MWKLAQEFKEASYTTDFRGMVLSMFYQDAAFWKGVFGECCCSGSTGYDSEREEAGGKEVFCSELAAKILMKSGVVKKVLPSGSFMPKDLSSDPHSKLTPDSVLWADNFGAEREIKVEVLVKEEDQKGPYYPPGDPRPQGR